MIGEVVAIPSNSGNRVLNRMIRRQRAVILYYVHFKIVVANSLF